MLDRQKIESVLARRFPGASHTQVAAATNAIMGLDDEWEEIEDGNPEFGFRFAADCRRTCGLWREFARGTEFRFFRRRES